MKVSVRCDGVRKERRAWKAKGERTDLRSLPRPGLNVN